MAAKQDAKVELEIYEVDGVVGLLEFLGQFVGPCPGCGGVMHVPGPSIFGPQARITCPVCNGGGKISQDFAMVQSLGMGRIDTCHHCGQQAWVVIVPGEGKEGGDLHICAACWLKAMEEDNDGGA